MEDWGQVVAVYLLTHDEPVRFDPGRVAEMYLEFGEDQAEQMLSAAGEDVAVGLSRLAKLGPHGVLTEIADIAAGLDARAEQCGMVDLARVARDVRGAASQIDIAALGATLARLSRVGDRSLSAIWGPCNASL